MMTKCPFKTCVETRTLNLPEPDTVYPNHQYQPYTSSHKSTNASISAHRGLPNHFQMGDSPGAQRTYGIRTAATRFAPRRLQGSSGQTQEAALRLVLGFAGEGRWGSRYKHSGRWAVGVICTSDGGHRL